MLLHCVSRWNVYIFLFFCAMTLSQHIFGSRRFERTYRSRNVVGKQYVLTKRNNSEERLANKTSCSVENRTSIPRSSSQFILPTEIFRLLFNPLAPNDVYIRRTAQLTSRRCILNIYSTNILTEYFKHAAHPPFFFSSRCRLFLVIFKY